MDFTPFTYIGGSVIALCVGFLTGMFGIGGGFLMAPALMIFLGIPAPIAIGTDLAAIFANSSFALLERRKTGTVDVKLALWLAAGSIIGILIGVWIIKLLIDTPTLVILGKEQQPVQYILFTLFFFLLIWIAGYLAFDLYRTGGKKPDKRTGLFAKIKIAPLIRFDSLESPNISLLPLLILGCMLGILIGMMRIGGGIILLPALIYLIGQRTVKAAGTSLLFIWISSLIAAVAHAAQGHVKPMLLAAMLLGGIIGTYCGTYVGLKLPGPRIRFYFVFVVIAATIMVGLKLYNLTFLTA